MRLACKCVGDSFVGDYSHAIIEMPHAYIAWLLGQMAKAKELYEEEPELYALVYFDHQVSYYSSLDIDDDVPDGEFIRVADRKEPDEIAGRPAGPTAAATVAVTNNAIAWRAYPKHSDGVAVQFETASMPEEQLRQLWDEKVVGSTP